MKRIATLALLSLTAAVCHGQGQAAQYQAAAQVYFTQAAQCQNPVGAACMRTNGRYNQCLAAQLGPGGPASCTAPTCSTSCLSGSSGSATGAVGSAGASKLANTINNGMQVYQLGKAFGLWGNSNSQQAPSADTGPTPEQLAAEQAAAYAAQQQQFNTDAANILNEANSMAGVGNAQAGTPPPSDSTSAVSALLDGSSSAPNVSAAVNALLGGSTDPNASTTAAVSNLLTPPASASGDTPSAQRISSCVANNMTNIQACLPNNANLPAVPPTQQTVTSDGTQELLDFPGDGSVTVVKYPALGSPVSETYNVDGSGTATYAATPSNPNGITVTNNSDGTLTYPAGSPQPTITTYNRDGSVTHPTPTANSDGTLTYPKLPSATPPKGNP